jgi:tetratricopeptide (TPR) repeat protein
MIVLYERIFVYRSFRECLARRFAFYLMLFLTWSLLAALVTHSGIKRGGAAGIVDGARSWRLRELAEQLGLGGGEKRCLGLTSEHWSYVLCSLGYLLTQAVYITLYIQLAFWPHPLVIDYGTDLIWDYTRIAPATVFVLSLFAITLWALFRRPKLGFLGAWFFFILAPSSSFMPLVTQIAAEKRMYLPLAAIVVLAVLAGYRALEYWRAGRQAGLRLLPWFERPAGETPAEEDGAGRRLVLRRVSWTALAGILAGSLSAALVVRTFLRNLDYHSQIGLWEATAKYAPFNKRAYLGIGYSYDALKNDDGGRNSSACIAKARAALQKAVGLDPRYGDGYLLIGNGYYSEQNWTEALAMYRKAVEFSPSASSHYNVALVLRQVGRREEAVTAYRECLRWEPKHNEALAALAEILAEDGRNEEARQEYVKLVGNLPNEARHRLGLGRALLKLERHDEAREALEEAVRLDANLTDAQSLLGNVLLTLGEAKDAEGRLRAALKLNSACTAASHDLARALLEQGRHAEAEAELRRLLEHSPESAQARYELGLLLHKQGRLADARAELEEALRRRPDHPETQYRLALVLLDEKNDAAGRSALEAALRLRGRWTEALVKLAWVCAVSADPAVRDAEAAIKRAEEAGGASDAKDPAALDALGVAYSAAGRFADAEVAAGKALELARAQGAEKLAGEIQQRIELYRRKQPYRPAPRSEPPRTSPPATGET